MEQKKEFLVSKISLFSEKSIKLDSNNNSSNSIYKINLHGKERLVSLKKIFEINKGLKNNILTFLKIENIPYSRFGKNCIEVNIEDKSLLIALDKDGIKQLKFLEQTFPKDSVKIWLKKNITFNIVERHILNPNQLTIKDGNEELIFALEIPKLEDTKDYSLGTLEQIYKNIEPTVKKYLIDGLDIGKIKYLKEFDTYVVTEITDYIEYQGFINKIELSFESFLTNGTFYLHNNRAINVKEYKFLKGVI